LNSGRRLAENELTALIADGLGLHPSEIDDELSFQAVPAWDSLGHAELMVALEESLGVEVDDELTLGLTSVAAIRAFAGDGTRPQAPGSRPQAGGGERDAVMLHRGLDGVVMDRTSISDVDGTAGRLLYRGYAIEDLLDRASFEEVSHMLLHGELPSAAELEAFEREFRSARQLPADLTRLLGTLTGVAPVTALRAAVSALDPGGGSDVDGAGLRAQGRALIARCPTIIAAHHALREGRDPPEPDPGLSHAANLLRMIEGARDDELAARIMDQVLVLQAEHGSGAATLAVRVAAGTRAGLYAAMAAALATFEGDNHGGAVERVMALIDEVGTPARAREYAERARERGEPVPGFGHRIYRVEDPRARPLRDAAVALSDAGGDDTGLEILEELRATMAPLARHGVNVNVDFYAALVYQRLGIPAALSTPLFAAARLAGWIAHAIEQYEHNVLIRPRLHYLGPRRVWQPIAERAGSRPPMPATRAEPAPAGSLLDGFVASVAAYGGRPALAVNGREWTYDEVDRMARSWAAAALAKLEPDRRRVAVLGYRSEVSYVAPLAALFAGAGFVPLNPTYPVARTRAMIERADPSLIFVAPEARSAAAEALEGLANPPAVIEPAALQARTPLTEPVPSGPDDLAYLLFTSGSTGAPKGVPISHRNVVHFLRHVCGRYELGPSDRLGQTFDQTFDLSIFDLFGAWWSGACVCSLKPIELQAPAAAIERLGLTVWFSVPSLPGLLRRRNLLRPGSLPGLRWSLFCGEPLSVSTAEAWQAAAPRSTLENLYGPTELTIACAQYRWDPERSPAEAVGGVVPIGDVYPGLDHAIIDEVGSPGAAEGELAVGGPQTFSGYWRDEDATEERMLDPSGNGRSGARLYRTGDRVRRLANGGLAFLGRSDHQVKVMGHRVELGEVEAALRGQRGVEEAVVVPWPADGATVAGLVGFVTGDAAGAEDLRRRLRTALPLHAVPQHVRVVEDLPLTANGKTDRAALVERLEASPPR
jgi:amino acid adenylation domain-containing protein